MVLTQGKDPLAWNRKYDKKEGMEGRKNVCVCAHDKRQKRASERPHRNILQHFNYSILEEEQERANQSE